MFRLFRPKGKGCDFVFAPNFFRNFVLVTNEVAIGRTELSLRLTKKIIYIFNGFSMVPRPETFTKSKKSFFFAFFASFLIFQKKNEFFFLEKGV